MSKELDDWLRKSEGDLRLAKLAYDGKEYWGAISHLQEADEKIGKATLIQLGLLTSDQGMKNIMETFFGAKHTEPKDLGHDWGAQMVKDLEPFLDSLEKMVRPMGKSDSLRQAADWWKTSLPDYRERLEKAKQLKSNPLPSLTEFDGVIKDCNKILELSREVPSKIKIGEVSLPKPDEIDAAANGLIKELLGVRVNKETRKALESKALTKLSQTLGSFEKELGVMVQLCYVLIELAVLNINLSQHHTLARYPTGKVVYDKDFPMVLRFNEVHSLLHRSLEMVRLSNVSS